LGHMPWSFYCLACCQMARANKMSRAEQMVVQEKHIPLNTDWFHTSFETSVTAIPEFRPTMGQIMLCTSHINSLFALKKQQNREVPFLQIWFKITRKIKSPWDETICLILLW
jgi:hypothetical protein